MACEKLLLSSLCFKVSPPTEADDFANEPRLAAAVYVTIGTKKNIVECRKCTNESLHELPLVMGKGSEHLAPIDLGHQLRRLIAILETKPHARWKQVFVTGTALTAIGANGETVPKSLYESDGIPGAELEVVPTPIAGN